ncbi:hypothetical protein F4678DRAFT_470039 [Xylaria arbuscula]|nr:hypothetical protein F4678DRAFT_470039 [Xylaria arbuscula]
MSVSQHSERTRRESLYSPSEDQDSIMYGLQGRQGHFSGLRASDVDVSVHEYPVHRERRHTSSYVPGSSYSRSRRDESVLYSDITTPRPSLDLVGFEPRRQRGRKSNFVQDEGTQVQRRWVEIPTTPRRSTSEFSEPTKPSGSQRTSDKMVRFSDKVYLNDGSPERCPKVLGHRRDMVRGPSEDYPTGAPGNGARAGELHHRGGYNNTVPRRLHSGERQRGHLPPAPMIPRLPTPDFESTSHYELSLGKYDFCACCSSDGRHEHDDLRWKRGRAKMEKQVDNARAYITQMTMSERLIADA